MKTESESYLLPEKIDGYRVKIKLDPSKEPSEVQKVMEGVYEHRFLRDIMTNARWMLQPTPKNPFSSISWNYLLALLELMESAETSEIHFGNFYSIVSKIDKSKDT